MTPALPRPIRSFLILAVATLLAACQSLPPQTGFNAEQVAVLKAEGFVETDTGWELTLPERLLFATDDANLKPEQIEVIANVARRLASVGIVSARVEGHTDSTGSDAYNLKLSQARAEVVAGPMRANGMTLSPEQVVGRGEALPLSDNATAEGRQDNRRVVVIVEP
ncbi:OmpA family protein [Sphingopyxis sp. YF1]|jgi:OOP family OmpA-OmpF porin|uniref:OmpA family protein n=1 Tax=Sphingopyxis sp. YF1 TaxID=2482763 RepID=UPI001F62556A|nr:OmpA family protein [Sphingopyxis sp. YF1]UNU41589.1 OmpA family protein [Sphingopyxis sp. YF1]HZG32556.1 OmpA family protein [Sphingopyxis sp.]